MQKRKSTLPLSIKAATQRKIVVELPRDIMEGIGRVVSSHSRMQHYIEHLLYDVMVAHAHVGRISVAYRDPAVHFSSVRKLIDAWGIVVSTNLEELEAEIRRHTLERNALAHGVWVFLENEEIALIKKQGQYDTSEGKRSAAVLPDRFVPSEGWFQDIASKIDQTTQKVRDLRKDVGPSLPPLPDISSWQ